MLRPEVERYDPLLPLPGTKLLNVLLAALPNVWFSLGFNIQMSLAPLSWHLQADATAPLDTIGS